LLFLCAAATARADEFSEFRIPEHTAWNWNANAALSTGSHDQNVASVDQSIGGWSGFLGTSLLWFTDAEPRLFAVQASASVENARTHQSLQALNFGGLETYDQKRHDDQLMERWAASINDREYPWAAPIGASIGLAGSGTYGQFSENAESNGV